MLATILPYAIVLIVAVVAARLIISALKHETPIQKSASTKRSNVNRVWTGSKQVIWHKEDDKDGEQRLVRFADEKTQTLLQGGSIEVFDALWEEWSTLFIRHTQGENEQLYAVHKKNPTELQLLGAWPTRKNSQVKEFRKSYAYYGGYYGKIPPILYQTCGVQFVGISELGEVTLRQITDPHVERLLTEKIEDAIEMILDTDDEDIVENIDEFECANAIDFTFTIRHTSKDTAKNIDVYRLRFKDLQVSVECLHEGCSSYRQEFRGQFFVIEKDGLVSMHRRLTDELLISGFDANQGWAYDTVNIDRDWHYAFIGVKDGVCIAQMDGQSKHVIPSEGAVEIRIIDGEAFYQLEQSENDVAVYDLYRFSDQKRMASFYGESPYLERQELSPGSRFRYDEDDAPEAEDAAPKAVPYHELAIRIN